MTLTSEKYENNWLFKTLENLERDFWSEPIFDSQLIKTCHYLRKKPLKDFNTEDLRIMIGQNIGLKYLIPFTLVTLEKDIFAEGNLYEGDLLKSVLNIETEFWKKEIDNFNELELIISKNEQLLREREPEFLNTFMALNKIINK